MSTTPSAPGAQAPSNPRRRRFNFEPRSIDPALRRRRIRIARAVCLVARTKCNVMVAVRACGLDRDHNAAQDIRDLCDSRRIPRRDRLGMPLIVPATLEPATDYVPLRHDLAKNRNLRNLPPSRRALADLVASLREIADPLGDDGEEATATPSATKGRRSRSAFARTAGAPSKATEVRSFAAADAGLRIGERSNEGRRDEATTN
jgi:hypothetical protein